MWTADEFRRGWERVNEIKKKQEAPKTCKTCRYADDTEAPRLRCRFDPPTIHTKGWVSKKFIGERLLESSAGCVGAWPFVAADDWCGKYDSQEEGGPGIE